MKCNICGGELPKGESVCKYCGNVVSNSEEKLYVKPEAEKTTPKPIINENKIDAEVYPQKHRAVGGYCVKCGRPLDGFTHKCVVCDAAEVSRRVNIKDSNKIKEVEQMAQKKKKKKKQNTVRNIILAILGMIVLFTLTLFFAFDKFSEWLGIGGKSDSTENPIVTVTKTPKTTADPDWEATTDAPEKTTTESTKKPARTPVPEPTGDPVELRGGEYLYESDTHLITVRELDDMEREEIKYIYWEIYARHGYTFDDELADYFESNHQWYVPTTSDKNEVEAEFNDIEKRNIKTIYDYQKKKGWR